MAAPRGFVLLAVIFSAPWPCQSAACAGGDDSCPTAAVDPSAGADPAPAQTEADVEQAEQREAEALDMRLLQARVLGRALKQEGLAKTAQGPSACSANANCKALGLEGDCCPNPAGVSLGCCDNFVPPAAPLGAGPLGAMPAETTPGTCESNAGCAALGLAGACCPNPNGDMLGCCDDFEAPVAPPVMVNYTGPAACSESPCAELGLLGNCCPNDDGNMLGCCSTLGAAAPSLAPPTVPGPLMTFYMYRVQDNVDYPLNGANLANLDGDVWYLHNEVVQHCPRKFNISRLLRFKVSMRSTAELNGQGHQFDSFVAFDQAKCTVPMCDKLHWNLYGYVVGCQPNFKGQVAVPGDPVWYSLPGTCPDKFYYEKTEECKVAEPGGMCDSWDVTGTRDCTYHFEKAGELSLDELTGLANYNDNCVTSGQKEYDIFQDKGNGTSFWDGKNDPVKGAARIEAIKNLFAKKYPDMPTNLQDPVCDAPR